MTTKNKNIVIITSEFPPQPGGIGNHAYNLAWYLTKENYIVQVVADQRSKTGDEELEFDQKAPFTITRIKRRNWRIKMYFNRVFKSYKCFKNVSYVIATGKFSLWNVAFLNLFFKIKTIAVIHGSEVNLKSIFLKIIIDLALKRMNKIVAVSSYTKNLISHLNKQVEVIPNGINFKNWTHRQNSKIKLIGNPILTTVGRVSARKGQLNVIKQLPNLIETFPKLHYHCIGILDEVHAFEKTAQELQVHSHVTFHGSLKESDLKQILNKTDVFVMLSSESKTGDVEGFGIAILEANAFGIPAIGTKGCGIEDAIKPNASGELIESDNSIQFNFAIERILKYKDNYKKESIKWAKQHDWSTIIKSYIALLE